MAIMHSEIRPFGDMHRRAKARTSNGNTTYLTIRRETSKYLRTTKSCVLTTLVLPPEVIEPTIVGQNFPVCLSTVNATWGRLEIRFFLYYFRWRFMIFEAFFAGPCGSLHARGKHGVSLAVSGFTIIRLRIEHGFSAARRLRRPSYNLNIFGSKLKNVQFWESNTLIRTYEGP